MLAGFGISTHALQPGDPARIRALGFRYARLDLTWARIETRAGLYDWESYDRRIADLAAQGLRPVLILAYSNPLYAPPSQSRQQAAAWNAPASAQARAAYTAWAVAAARRYNRYNPVLELWNEPDSEVFWPPKADADAYIRLAQDSCQAIRRATPEAEIWGPALSAIGNENGRASAFLAAVLVSDLPDCLSAISLHPYLSLHEVEDLAGYWAQIRALPGAAGRRFVASEWGFSSAFRGMDDQIQASYLIRFAALAHMAGQGPSLWYTWRNEGADPTVYVHNYGLVFPDGSPKPAYHALATFRAMTLGREHQCLLENDDLTALYAWSQSAPQDVLMIVWRKAGRLFPAISGSLRPDLPEGATEVRAANLYGQPHSFAGDAPTQGLQLSGQPMPWYIRWQGDLPAACVAAPG
nr:cellulase family glycosylhydrolase [Pseudogemmobacter hezensis]